MKWTKFEDGYRIPVNSWCENCEEGAVQQAVNLAHHPVLVHHVALMPDAHQGYGMPIGGVVAARNAVIPAAVGVDIGCGMCAIQTNIDILSFVLVLAFDLAYLAFIIFASKKLGWFSRIRKDDVAEFNEKIASKKASARKQNA